MYQLLVLIPQGYGTSLATPNATLHWINTHNLQFLGYRLLLILGFAFMISLPFTLFRIIVAQEILGSEEQDEEQEVGDGGPDRTDDRAPLLGRGPHEVAAEAVNRGGVHGTLGVADPGRRGRSPRALRVPNRAAGGPAESAARPAEPGRAARKSGQVAVLE